jgi:copper chaperone CopZ
LTDSATELSYQVEGMTCSHCAAAVTKSVSALPGAREVRVDLESGRLELRGEQIDDDAVRAAVAEAGYTLA